MAQTIKIKALDGTAVEFTDTLIGQGGMKDVYFSPDKSYVVAFFRDIPKGTAEYSATKDRLLKITGIYRERLFTQIGGEY